MKREEIVKDNKARWDVFNPLESTSNTLLWVVLAIIVGALALYLLA